MSGAIFTAGPTTALIAYAINFAQDDGAGRVLVYVREPGWWMVDDAGGTPPRSAQNRTQSDMERRSTRDHERKQGARRRPHLRIEMWGTPGIGGSAGVDTRATAGQETGATGEFLKADPSTAPM